MAKKQKQPTLRIIKVTDYKGYKIMIQHIIPAFLFQVILFKDGQFYQAHDILTPPKGQKALTTEEEIKAGVLYLDTAMIIADKLEESKDAVTKDISKLN